MRDLDLNVLDALDEDQIAMAILGEFEFLSGTQNLWAGPEGHAIEWDGKTWIALGDIGQIDKLGEAQGLADSRTTVALRIDSDLVDEVAVEDSRGRAATVILLIMSDQGTPIGEIRFRTTMGGTNIKTSAAVDETGRKLVQELLSLELLNETATLENSHFVRNTYEAGLRIDANDHGLEFVSDPDVGNLGVYTGGGGRRDNRGRHPARHPQRDL